MVGEQSSGGIRSPRVVAVFTILLVAGIVAQPARAQTYTVLHAFTGSPDGADPNPLIRDARGNLYGTTKNGGLASCGQGNCGTVFKVDSAGKETIVYSFEGGSNGSNPVAGLVRDATGNLYGTTQGDGTIGGQSVVFKVDPKGQQTVLYVADGPDASSLDSPLTLDAQGNLYGMSPYGGNSNCGDGGGCGTLFKISADGKFTLLHAFAESDGRQPEGGLVIDAKGNLYGTTNFGGDLKCESLGYGYRVPGCGTVFKLASDGKFTVLHTFTGKGNGSFPLGLIIDSAGNLYGIAQNGGHEIQHSNFEYGVGTIFKVDTSSQFNVLFSFVPCTQPPCTRGQVRNPVFASHLVRDSKGNLYGAEQSNNCAKGGGCLFRLDAKGKLTDIYDFAGYGETHDGNLPMSVVLGSKGDFYGSMYIGGATACNNGCGTVFHLVP